MIQEAEAWLLSQPEVLVEQAGIDMSKFNCLKVETIKNPSDKLADLYKKSGKTYNKVRDFAKIFPKLDTKKLKQTCSEFKALIDGQADTASLLIENGILSDNVYVAATSIKKIGALEEYEASLAKDHPESYREDRPFSRLAEHLYRKKGSQQKSPGYRYEKIQNQGSGCFQ